MSGERWAREAAVEHQLSATSAHVLLLLATYADEAGECFPGLEKLAAAARRSERQVRDALADLKRRELIERRGRGPGRSALTRLAGGSPPPIDRQPTAAQAAWPAAHRMHDRRPAACMTGGQPPPEHPGQRPGEQQPPQPPEGGRERDRRLWEREASDWARAAYPHLVDRRRLDHAVRQAVRYGEATTKADVDAWLQRWFPDLVAEAAA